MKTNSKRLIAILLTAWMIIALIPIMTVSVSAALPDDKLIAKYAMDEVVNGYMLDGSGNGKHALARNINIVKDSTKSSAAKFNEDSFIMMPEWILEGCKEEVTVSVWYKYDDTNGYEWRRIWEFGTTNVSGGFWSLTPKRGDEIRLFNEYWGNDLIGNPRVTHDEGSIATPEILCPYIDGKWAHLVMTVDKNQTKMYIDGKLIEAVQTALMPQDFWQTTQNYLGKSVHGTDKYFEGLMSDVCIYSVSLSEAQVGELNKAAKFVTPDSVKASAPAAAIKAAAASGQAVDNIVARYSLSEIVPGPSGWALVKDDINGNDGVLIGSKNTKFGGNKIVKDATRGNVLRLDGDTGFVQLPDDLLRAYDAVTVTCWYYFDTAGDAKFPDNNRGWARLFDFGNFNNISYMNFVPRRGDNQCAGSEFKCNDGGQHWLDVGDCYENKWVHIAVTFKAGQNQLYIDGKLIDDNAPEYGPKDFGHTWQNYIGKSQWSDAFFIGYASELIIYNKILSADEIKANMGKDFSYLTPVATVSAPVDVPVAPAETPAEVVSTPAAAPAPAPVTSNSPRTGDASIMIFALILTASLVSGGIVLKKKQK